MSFHFIGFPGRKKSFPNSSNIKVNRCKDHSFIQSEKNPENLDQKAPHHSM